MISFVTIARKINQIFTLSLVSRHTRIQIYKTLTRSTLSYDCELRTINDE
jgi:hypothetical protein